MGVPLLIAVMSFQQSSRGDPKAAAWACMIRTRYFKLSLRTHRFTALLVVTAAYQMIIKEYELVSQHHMDSK